MLVFRGVITVFCTSNDDHGFNLPKTTHHNDVKISSSSWNRHVYMSVAFAANCRLNFSGILSTNLYAKNPSTEKVKSESLINLMPSLYRYSCAGFPQVLICRFFPGFREGVSTFPTVRSANIFEGWFLLFLARYPILLICAMVICGYQGNSHPMINRTSS